MSVLEKSHRCTSTGGTNVLVRVCAHVLGRIVIMRKADTYVLSCIQYCVLNSSSFHWLRASPWRSWWRNARLLYCMSSVLAQRWHKLLITLAVYRYTRSTSDTKMIIVWNDAHYSLFFHVKSSNQIINVDTLCCYQHALQNQAPA